LVNWGLGGWTQAPKRYKYGAGRRDVTLNDASLELVYQHSAGTLRIHSGANADLGESAMHPTIQTEIMKARTAERQRKADQARLAQASKQGRRVGRQHGTSRVLRRLRLRPILRRLAI
jgi:hypothetical protein